MYHDDTADSEAALKGKAEEMLTEFVTSLGAAFPAGSSDGPEAKTATTGEE